MAQPSTIQTNGFLSPGIGTDENMQSIMVGKRKRDLGDEGEEGEAEGEGKGQGQDQGQGDKANMTNGWPKGNEKELIQSYFQVLSSFDIKPAILKRCLAEPEIGDEPQAKRQKSAEPNAPATISDKVAANVYAHIDDVAKDILVAVQHSLADLKSDASDGAKATANEELVAQIDEFKDKALQLLRHEKAYPKATISEPLLHETGPQTPPRKVLSLIGYAPQERRLFTSLPVSDNVNLSEVSLPQGVTATQVMPSTPRERTQTLGELFASPRTLAPLQPPKQPKTQAKGNTLDFYHPELADQSKYRVGSYFSAKLSAGHYLDYSNAAPTSQPKAKQRERAQSLAGQKPSTSDMEVSEMEALFRGAFSSFAPCKDDTAALVPSSVAGRLWWQQTGQRHFQNTIEMECYGNEEAETNKKDSKPVEIDEKAVEEAINNWDEAMVDPSLDEIMGSKRAEEEKEADEILEEVTDLIETLASYQRIRNLTLPNSQNRQSSDPVNSDMLTNNGPQPSDEEQATYQMLKAQLALIIKTLPPYAVAKLNGDQLEDLLISTKVEVQTDQYRGVMEEDDVAVQARIRAQQAAQANARPSSQRTPSISGPSYAYQPGPPQYSTPTRTPAHPQYYRPPAPPPYQAQQRPIPPSQPRQQPNQYNRPNGFPNQYATQLAKAQTPYGHQNMPQYASQQRPQYGQMPQPGTPTARYGYQQGYPHQPPGTPSQGSYNAYTNGAGMPPRNMSPQVPHRQSYSPSPGVQHNQQPPPPQRFGTPNQPPMGGQMNRYPSNPPPPQQQQQHPHPHQQQAGPPNPQNPGLTGYHTVIPEAQQQRILDQAKARVAAQERTAMFNDKITPPSVGGLPRMGLVNSMDANRIAAARAAQQQQQQQYQHQYQHQQKAPTPGPPQRQGSDGTPGPHIPVKVTPVPVPPIPGLPQQRKQSS